MPCLVFTCFFGSYLAKKLFIALIVLLYWAYCFLSLLIPFIEVTTNHQVEVQQTMLTIEQVLLMAEMEPATVDATGGVAVHQVASLSWIEILLLVYLAGIIFFACRNLYSLIRLFRLIHSGKREKVGEWNNTCCPRTGDSSVQLDEVYRYQPEGFGGERAGNSDS